MSSEKMAKDSNKYEARAWSTDEMRQECGSWTLEGDVGLLMSLQQFSQNVISKTHEMEKAIDDLVHETKMASAKVHNVINGFHMLSNTQFVETRVYDEDIQESTPSQEKKEESKTKEQREAELIPKISLALNLGLKVIDEAFDKYEIQHESDSEEDEANFVTTPILEPKDPYIHRPLPYIIGSDAFNADDHIGLGELLPDGDARFSKESSEDVESDVSEEDSENDFEDVSVEAWNTAPVKAEKVPHPVPKGKKMSISSSSSEEESSDLFAAEKRNGHDSGSSFSSEENLAHSPGANQTIEDQEPPRIGPAGFKEELAAALGGNIKASKPTLKKESKEKKPPSKRSSVSTLVPPMDDDYEEEEDSPFSKGGGLFSGGGKLFGDEDEDDGDLFGSSYTSKSSKDVSRTQTLSKDDLFGESEDSSPQQPVVPESKGRRKSSEVLKKPKQSFLDDNDDDDDLFSSPVVRKESKSEKRTSTLFEDEDDDDLFSTGRSSAASSSTAESKKLPAGAVSLFGGLSGELGKAIKSQRQHSSDSESEVAAVDEVRSSRSSLSSKQSSMEKEVPKPKATTTTTSSLDLFSEDAEDDLFASTTKSRSTTNTSSSSSSTDKNRLFGGSFTASTELPKTELQQKAGSVAESVKAPSATTAVLFGADSEIDTGDDLFSSSKTTEKKKTEEAPLFNDELFAPAKKGDDKKAEQTKSSQGESFAKKVKKISLFDSDDDTEDDIFSSAAPKRADTASLKSNKSSEKDLFSPVSEDSVETDNSPEPVVTKPKSNSVFEDEDLLFGGPASESPNVDLFAPSASPKKPVGGVSIFGGVNLFSGDLGKKKLEQREKEEAAASVEVEESPNRSEPTPISIPVKSPPKDTKELSVSFDDPIDVSNTLSNANRGRAKIQTKRRLPTRKGRQARQAASSESEEQTSDVKSNVVSEVETKAPHLPLSSPQLESPLEETLKVPAPKSANSFTSPSTEEDDLFADLGPPPEIFETKPKKLAKTNVEDLFGSTNDKLGLGNDEDIFAPLPSTKKEVDEKQTIVKTSFDPDDIFADMPRPETSGDNHASASTSKLLENGEEDIFETSVLSSMAAGSNDDNLFGDDSEDIFADLSTTSRRETWKMKKSDSLFGDDNDEDIFGTSTKTAVSTSKKETTKKSTVPKSATQRVETDIFDDPLLKNNDFD